MSPLVVVGQYAPEELESRVTNGDLFADILRENNWSRDKLNKLHVEICKRCNCVHTSTKTISKIKIIARV